MAALFHGVVREPQNWINLIGVGTLLALGLGVFEPAEVGAERSSERSVQMASAQDTQAR